MWRSFGDTVLVLGNVEKKDACRRTTNKFGPIHYKLPVDITIRIILYIQIDLYDFFSLSDRISYIPGGAGFCPSTLQWYMLCQPHDFN